MKLKNLIGVVSTTLALLGCQSFNPQSAPSVAAEVAASAPVTAEVPAPSEASAGPTEVPERDDLWQRIRGQITLDEVDNSRIATARAHYLNQRNYIPMVSARAAPYLHYIVEQVELRGMPIEVALLPMVESSFNPFAYSSGKAAGLWQIMPSTGTDLGLTQNWWYDGRRDLRDSTAAALDYLQAMHADLGEDWLLALAAYNSGKGRVQRAQRANRKKNLPTDYWSLDLPRETRDYVPRLIALAGIIADPEGAQVELTELANTPAFTVVATGGQIELARAASLAEIEPRLLNVLNPGQLRWATAPDQAPELLVPIGDAGARLSAGVASLTAEDRVQWQHYRIERGDSLIRIANKFDTQVGLLREVNRIKGSNIRAGATLMIPKGNDWVSSLALDNHQQATTKRGYRVRSGDSLYRIAGRFKVTISDIIGWNSLDPQAYLKPGQKLTLYVGEG